MSSINSKVYWVCCAAGSDLLSSGAAAMYPLGSCNFPFADAPTLCEFTHSRMSWAAVRQYMCQQHAALKGV